MRVKKKRYIAVFLVSEQGTYSVLRLRRFSPSNLSVRYGKGNATVINIHTPTYAKGIKLYYFIDIAKGQLNFKDKGKDVVNKELIDMVVRQSIVKQLTNSLREKLFGGQIMNILIGLAIGIPAGIIAGGYL